METAPYGHRIMLKVGAIALTFGFSQVAVALSQHGRAKSILDHLTSRLKLQELRVHAVKIALTWRRAEQGIGREHAEESLRTLFYTRKIWPVGNQKTDLSSTSQSVVAGQ